MNLKTLTLTAVASFIFAAGGCPSSANPHGSPGAAPHERVTKPVPTNVDASVTAVGQLRAQLILRTASYPLDPGLTKPGMLATLQALVEPDLQTIRKEHAAAFLGLLKMAGFKPDGTRVANAKPPSNTSPKALATVARYKKAQRDLQAAEAAAAAKYTATFGNKRRKMPLPAQAFDASIRLTNTGSDPLTVRLDGDDQHLTTSLSGPGAVIILSHVDNNEVHMIGAEQTIAPGGHLDVPLTSLSYGTRTRGFAAYATKPGIYSVQVSKSLMARRGNGNGTNVELRFPLVRFEVR